MLRLAGSVLILLFAFAGVAQPPPLPEGLGDAPSSEEPALPSGLEPSGDADATAPPLPPGLEGAAEAPQAGEEADAASWRKQLPFPLHGYFDARAGARIQEDPAHPKDASIAETRLQLKTEKALGEIFTEFTADVYLDGIREQADLDVRLARLTWTPAPSIDVRVGRQVLTWGTGDMLFINDLFPKDWQSYFIGRDDEYLKAPSDAVKASWFTDLVNVELVYTPQFDRDRHITGEYISYYNPLTGRTAATPNLIKTNPPSDRFTDDEIAVRLYRNVGAYEIALYGYSGYWKSPGGQRIVPMQATFPELRVYGASMRGPLGPGIANAEIGYYDSYEDGHGDRPLVNNSELRLLVGYEQELAKEFTGAVQYYLEHMMDYDAYRNTLPFLFDARDEDRHVFTVRLTKMLMNQNLTLSFFGYVSPSDSDAYLRPKVSYKLTDDWLLETGGNLFMGRHDHTFFGQFEDNSNVYGAVRYSF
jgi:hypothetical protein